MVSLLPTKFQEILFSSFRGVALTNCVTDRRTGQKQYVSHQNGGGGGDINISQHGSLGWAGVVDNCQIPFHHLSET